MFQQVELLTAAVSGHRDVMKVLSERSQNDCQQTATA